MQGLLGTSWRRLIYYVLLGCAVLGPTGLTGFSFVGKLAWRFQAVLLFGGLVATALLCAWCSIYVRAEPHLVRIALIWIVVLSLIVTVAIAIAGNVQ